MRSIAFVIVLACFLPIAQANTTLGITDAGLPPGFVFSGPTAFSLADFWWWNDVPALSAGCTALTTCDTSPGGLNVAGLQYEQPGNPGPFGGPGLAIESFVNIYESDGVTLSDTLQLILRNQGPVRTIINGSFFTVQTASVQMIFHSADDGLPLTAYTTGSVPVVACVLATGSASVCTISSMIETGGAQNLASAGATSILFTASFQSIDAVPEPTSFVLLGGALIGMGLIVYFKRADQSRPSS